MSQNTSPKTEHVDFDTEAPATSRADNSISETRSGHSASGEPSTPRKKKSGTQRATGKVSLPESGSHGRHRLPEEWPRPCKDETPSELDRAERSPATSRDGSREKTS